MEFFIPFAKDKEQEQEVYSNIRKFLSQELGATFDARKVFSLDFTHDGKHYYAEVGQTFSRLGEPVIAILHEPGRKLYHICTPNRGVARGMSYLTGQNEVNRVVDFDDEE